MSSRIFLAEETQCMASNAHGAPEIGLQNSASRCFVYAFELAHLSVSRVVKDDIDAAEHLFGPTEGFNDVRLIRNIDLEREDPIARVLFDKDVEGGWLTSSSHHRIAFLQGELRQNATEPRRRSGYCCVMKLL
ncbi:hypothetical protein BN946_scf184970.g130 [Trametes cinnabarina]|uniref:Uncharacterized protein n=1 Tax=Pycnoporus cinnabarinus TaxID=5643 RepID=A0A060SIM8_PYCCI|nr:hypothetical protein BN946_scf184970.g130 [Trametes cinnabarina]